MKLLLRSAASLLVASVLLAPPVLAQTTFTPVILGLGTITGPNFRREAVGSQAVIQINPTTGASLNQAPVTITGVVAGQTLVGIDYRPANNLIYALGYDGSTAGNNTQLYTLNLGTNAVTAVGAAIRLALGSSTARIGFDFNPTVDRIRVTSTNRADYRLNPNDGSLVATDGMLTYAPGTAAATANLVPQVSAVAYANSFAGSTTTALYDVDYRNTINGPFNGILSQQTPANSGVLDSLRSMSLLLNTSSPGPYGIGQPDALGLDVYYDPSTNQNVGYLTEVTAPRSNGNRASNTYRLNLKTGQATQLGNTIPSTPTNFFNFEIRDLAVAIAPIPTLTWNGSVSTAWRNAANWTPNIIPALPNNVIIPGGTPFQPTVSLPQQCSAVTLGPGAVLTTAPGGTLVVQGNFANNGGSVAGSGDGGVLFNLNVNQTIGGTSPTIFQNMGVGAGTATLNAASLTGPVSVRRLLTLYGNLNVTGQTFTLLSDANNTAAVVNFAGVVNGPVTVQRYIEPSRNGGLGYRHYAPPVSNTTVQDFAVTGGFTPVINGAFNNQGNTAVPFPNVYGYDQAKVGSGVAARSVIDQGYFSPTSLGQALNSTQGYTVNINAPVNVDFVGSLVNGPVSTPALPRSAHPQGGWHLRGNPYPAPLDWQLMIDHGQLTNIDPALYIFKSSGQYTGSYGTYINGIPANGGSNLIPTSQGFYVRTSGVGLNGQLNFTNAERLTTYANPAFQRGTADLRPQLALSLGNATATLQTVVYCDPTATAAFDPATDASYLAAKNGLLLATEAGAEALAINGLPPLTGADVRVPLQVAAATAGQYKLALDRLTNLPTGYRIYLHDVLSGAYTDLTTTPQVAIRLTAGAPAAGRYALLFTTQARVLATASAALAQLVSVYPNPAHGTAALLLPLALRGASATPVQVLDPLGRVVLTRTLASDAELLELPLSGLAPGIYAVQARTAAGLVVKRLVVE